MIKRLVSILFVSMCVHGQLLIVPMSVNAENNPTQDSLTVSETYTIDVGSQVSEYLQVSRSSNGNRYVGQLQYSGKASIINGKILAEYKGYIEQPSHVAISTQDNYTYSANNAMNISHIQFISLEEWIPETLSISQSINGMDYSGEIAYTGDAQLIGDEMIFYYEGIIEADS
ncbi:hypothetical protein [Fundicoccus culcitae]|uniref:Uncharacterized protein n=1 Tax=Fundicoccus culcitae TaxID=2969821 RepID=A0ABY5P6K3_9LACT|nr:hypothetical protein [Fundicoccus culcitae]UUX34373.1 hypothetical protein NRE15_01605 [Fundicoccus culcitae]